jgi:hypothetical protein
MLILKMSRKWLSCVSPALLIMADGAAQAIGMSTAFCFNRLPSQLAAFQLQQVEAVGEDVFPIIRLVADRACCRRSPAAHRRRSATQV